MVKTAKGLMDLWATLSRKILACVLTDAGAIFPVLEVVKNNAEWFSPKERSIWRGVLACIENDTPPTVETVAARTPDIEPGYIQTVAALFNEDDNHKLIYHAEQLKAIGIWAGVRQIAADLGNVESVEDTDKAVDKALTALSGLYANKNDRDASAGAVDEVAWVEIENFDDRPIPTGLQWFDKLSGGLWRGMNYWFAAPYKSGKSTIMRNLILHAAEQGHPAAAYCAEGKREMFVLDCQAMLATRVLVHYYDASEEPRFRLSGQFIKRCWRDHKETPVFTKEEYEAIQIARQEWQRLPIRVYDTRDGIRDLTTLQYDIKRDKMQHGIEVVWLDYSQLFGAGATIYDRQSATALRLQEVAQTENVAVVAIAQKNEEGIGAGDSYSPKVKGGGDAAAAADALFVPAIDQEIPDILRIKLKLSRHTATGEGMHKLQPTSGLILKELTPAAK